MFTMLCSAGPGCTTPGGGVVECLAAQAHKIGDEQHTGNSLGAARLSLGEALSFLICSTIPKSIPKQKNKKKSVATMIFEMCLQTLTTPKLKRCNHRMLPSTYTYFKYWEPFSCQGSLMRYRFTRNASVNSVFMSSKEGSPIGSSSRHHCCGKRAS